MENSSENQLAIIILKIGFHLELTITGTSVVGWASNGTRPLQPPVCMKSPSWKGLPNDVNSSECELDNKDDEHNTKVYESVEEMVDETSNNIVKT